MKKSIISFFLVLLTLIVVFASFVCICFAIDSSESKSTDVLYGDVNGDGEISALDIVVLRSYFLNFDIDTQISSVQIAEGADADGNGKVELSDLILLRQYFASYNYDTNEPGIVLGGNKTKGYNLMLYAEDINGYLLKSGDNKGFDAPEIMNEDGNSYVRLSSDETGAVYAYLYQNASAVDNTGEYAMIKYRITSGVASGSFSVFSGTVKASAGNDGDQVVSGAPALVADGGWHVAIIKLDTTRSTDRFVKNDAGEFVAKYLRIGYVATAASNFDVEYIAFSDDITKIGDAVGSGEYGCTHYYYYEYESESSHTRICAICRDMLVQAHSLENGATFIEDKGYEGTCSQCKEIGITPFNIYITPDKLAGFHVTNATSVEKIAATEDDIEFTRITGAADASKWLYFNAYRDLNAPIRSGQYLVFKYRVPTGGVGYAHFRAFTVSGESERTSPKEDGDWAYYTWITANDQWQIGVLDLSDIQEYMPDENGDYYVKFLRFDAKVSVLDLAFMGICEDLDAVMLMSEGSSCAHKIYNYTSDFNGHAKTTCAICGTVATDTSSVAHTWGDTVYDEKSKGYRTSCTVCDYSVIQEGNNELNLFIDPWMIKDASVGYYGNQVIMTEEDESVFVRLYGKDTQPYFKVIDNANSLNTNTATTGHYFIFKYRIPNNGLSHLSMRFYISSVETGVAGSENAIDIQVCEDNEWHVLVLDLTKTGNTEGFPTEVLSLLRFDLFVGKTVSTTQYIDVAYAGFSDDLSELRNFDSDYEMLGYEGGNEIKSLFGTIATVNTDPDHNNLSYATVKGSGSNYVTIYKNSNIYQGTGNYIGVLYRNATPGVTARFYFGSANAYDTTSDLAYDSSEGWHYMLFDFSEILGYNDTVARTVRFDPFLFSSLSCTVDIAYIQFFATRQDAIDYYGQYVKTYLDAENCDHLDGTWSFGEDGDASTDGATEIMTCSHCGKVGVATREASFSINVDRVTDAVGSYPSDVASSVGSSIDTPLIFSSTAFAELYPASGITVQENGSLSVSGSIKINGQVCSFAYKVLASDGSVLKAWTVCDGYVRVSATDPLAMSFAAYADMSDISGEGMTVIFAAIPAGLAEGANDKYIEVIRIENVMVSAEAVKQNGVTLEADKLNGLMTNLFDGTTVTNETVMFMDYGQGKTLLYPADRIISVKNYAGTVTYVEGIDYALVDGKIVILEGSSIPCITSEVYYSGPASGYGDALYTMYNGEKTSVYWAEGYRMTSWQVNVEYEHSSEWSGYEQADNSDIYAAFIEKLMNGENVTVFYYGDSITVGANSSFYHDYAPKQYGYALLLTNALADLFGYTVEYVDTSSLNANLIVPKTSYVGGARGTITYINAAVGGWKSADGVANFEKHVADYIEIYGCDLFVVAFGMNDKTVAVNTTVSNIETIIDGVLALEEDTAVMMVSTMVPNNTSVDLLVNQHLQEAALLESAETYRNEGVACAVTCMTSMSQSILERKEFMDYTGNNLNHPNDFYSRVYAQTLLQSLIGYENIK